MLICDKCKSVLVHTETPYEINYKPVFFPFENEFTKHIVCPKCFKEFENKFLMWVGSVDDVE